MPNYYVLSSQIGKWNSKEKGLNKTRRDNSLLTLWAGRFRYTSCYHPYSSPVRQISLFSIVWKRDEATCPITQLKNRAYFFNDLRRMTKDLGGKSIRGKALLWDHWGIDLEVRPASLEQGSSTSGPQTSTTRQPSHSADEWWVSEWSFICTHSP